MSGSTFVQPQEGKQNIQTDSPGGCAGGKNPATSDELIFVFQGWLRILQNQGQVPFGANWSIHDLKRPVSTTIGCNIYVIFMHSNPVKNRF